MVDAVIILAAGIILMTLKFSIFALSTYNGLVRLRNEILKAWANIDVMLKQRTDEIPPLVSIVKGYMRHESEVLTEVAKARSTLERVKSVGEKAAADKLVSDTLKKLYAVVEGYPEIKADKSFLKLQRRITGLENTIADRRELYNDAVTIYNTEIETLPERIIAKMAGFERMPLFKATKKGRKSVKVLFQKLKNTETRSKVYSRLSPTSKKLARP